MAFPEYVPDTTVDEVTYTLTSIAEIERMYSRSGVQLHTDDLDPEDANHDADNNADATKDNFLEEVIQRATSEIMSFLAPRYTTDAVYQIPRMREIATYWACYKISKRRGNEPIYEEEYIEAMDELADYRSGVRYLDAPSNGPRAYLQSQIVDLRFSRHPIRTLPEASTSTISGQKVAVRYFDWL